jgi:hypothetical protein
MEGSLVAYKVFTNGSTLQASELNENLMQQSTAVFSNAAARTAAITSPVEGQLTYLEDADRYDHWNGSSWSSPFGLTLVGKQVIGTAVTSITITNAFSADYDNYKIIVTGGTASTSGVFTLKLGAVAANYRSATVDTVYSSGVTSTVAYNGVALWNDVGGYSATAKTMNLDLFDPFNGVPSRISGWLHTATRSGTITGFLNDNTSVTDFTIAASSGNLTGGTIYVYGYRKN